MCAAAVVNVVARQMRRLFEGSVYLENEHDKGFSKILIERYIFNLGENLTVTDKSHSFSRALFKWRLQSNINHFELKNIAFSANKVPKLC